MLHSNNISISQDFNTNYDGNTDSVTSKLGNKYIFGWSPSFITKPPSRSILIRRVRSPLGATIGLSTDIIKGKEKHGRKSFHVVSNLVEAVNEKEDASTYQLISELFVTFNKTLSVPIDMVERLIDNPTIKINSIEDFIQCVKVAPYVLATNDLYYTGDITRTAIEEHAYRKIEDTKYWSLSKSKTPVKVEYCEFSVFFEQTDKYIELCEIEMDLSSIYNNLTLNFSLANVQFDLSLSIETATEYTVELGGGILLREQELDDIQRALGELI